ncbi:MAG TPA: asparagine synthase-related protein [Sedimentisphaerales bacterium]|nr:asparagine synthase-related protein [Sedimentisphaerales bacterium]
MTKLETSLHLYQPPLYRGAKGSWKRSFADAVHDCGGRVTWDLSAVLSILAFGYTCGDRTLVNEVKRQPWLSQIGPENEPQLEEIPPHGRLLTSPERIAEDLCRLLCEEALIACQQKKEIYVLLSGGLDSRIVAGIMAKLHKEGKIAVKPICVTWGLKDCRDVVYGRMVADILGSDWQHVGLSAKDMIANIEEVTRIGSLVSPVHLHRVQWLSEVSKDALVIASSYGDMVGRAEFSGQHLLDLDYLRPANPFGLVHNSVVRSAYEGAMNDLRALHRRSLGQPRYVTCEHEMHGHYTRNMLGQAMSAINYLAQVYQMFTNPKVYSYMWSIHPALRNDQVYAVLLEQLDHRLARIPWARTNRALVGKTVGARSNLKKSFHAYESWIGDVLFDRLREYIDPAWFAETGLYDAVNIRKLAETVKYGQDGKGLYGFAPYGNWVWLAAFRRMAEHLGSHGISVELAKPSLSKGGAVSWSIPDIKRSAARRILSRSAFLYSLVRHCSAPFRGIHRRIHKRILSRRAIRRYPPEKSRG